LGKGLFDCFNIKDIFLFSKLSDEGKVRFTPDNIPLPLNANERENQYLAYIANFNGCICAEQRDIKVDVGALYNFWLKDNYKLRCSVGFNLPIISRLRIMNLTFEGPNYKEIGFDITQMKNAMDEFHKRFDSITDFFYRAVLEPKCLCFCERQRELGIGDFFCFALFDLASFFNNLDGFQIGAEISFPTGKKSCDNNIWSIGFGSGGAYQFGLSAKMMYETSTNYFNPVWGIRGRFFSSYKSMRRVPKLVMNSANESVPIDEIDCLIVPTDLLALDYKTVYVGPFSSFDSCEAAFSDRAFCTRTKLGNIFEIDLGNYFYNVFKSNFTFNIFYEFSYKGCDDVCVLEKTGTYNTYLLTRKTRMKIHMFTWALDYMYDDAISISIGSMHVLGGANVQKSHKIDLSLTAVF